MSASTPSDDPIEVSIVMPCLNEERTLPACIEMARQAFRDAGVRGEIVIGDNGSTDRSVEVAEAAGCVVAHVPDRGYGAALLGAIAAAKGEYVLMGDADASYDFTELVRFLPKLKEGHDLVMGNRFRGEIQPGAMPFLHKYLGNPVLSGIGRLFFRTGVGDFHCGLRAFRRSAIDELQLACTGMEFASEMVVKAALNELRIAEVPATLRPDGRDRPPNLRTWRDGWRHLRFLLVYSPRWLFFYPGALAVLLGAALMMTSLLFPDELMARLPLQPAGGTTPLALLGAAATLAGAQAVFFSVLSRVYAMAHGLLPETRSWRTWLNVLTLEHGIVLGLLAAIAGAVIGGFGLTAEASLKLTLPGAVLLALGTQTVLASFFLSLLGMPTGRAPKPPGQ